MTGDLTVGEAFSPDDIAAHAEHDHIAGVALTGSVVPGIGHPIAPDQLGRHGG